MPRIHRKTQNMGKNEELSPEPGRQQPDYSHLHIVPLPVPEGQL